MPVLRFRAEALHRQLLKWILGTGETQAAALGYLALPADVVAKEQTALAKL
jgi:hypothetical protein